MFAAGLCRKQLQKNEEQVAHGPSSVTCSLGTEFREKRIRGIAMVKHRVFPVTRRPYSSIWNRLVDVQMK
jgi:hypothetical protein